MSTSRYFAIILLLVTIIHLISNATIINSQIPIFGKIEQPSTQQAEIISNTQTHRTLQAITINQPATTPNFSSIIQDINKVRTEKGISPIIQNASLNVIVSQWQATVSRNMPVVQYLQLYGSLNMQTFTFESVPGVYLKELIENECKECYLQDYTQIGSYL